MVEKQMIDGHEVVQMPIDDFMSMMEPIAAEQKVKDDIYRARIETAKQHLADGHQSLTMDDIRKSCRTYADKIERQKGDVAM